jgi:hypothetical protein
VARENIALTRFFVLGGVTASVRREAWGELLLYGSEARRYFRAHSLDAVPDSCSASGTPASSHAENGACEFTGALARLQGAVAVER